MTRTAILALDQGTSNSKAVLVAQDGSVIVSRSRAMHVDHPRSGWAEQSAASIWDAVVGLIDEIVVAAPDITIAALAISNQRETVVLWDAETGLPLGPAVTWQCGRSADRCAALRDAGHAEDIFARSGLALDPMFSAGKLAWLLDSVPGARARAAAGTLRGGTIDSWLVWNLTGGAVHATEHGNASRTQLFNLDTLDWDAELARLFDVPLAILPKILPSDSHFGTVASGLTALPAATPIHAVLGDSHAALFEHIAASAACVKATMGTGSSVMAATDRRIHSTLGLSSTIGWSSAETVQHAIEGNIMVSGQAAAFTTALLGLADEAALTALAATVDDSAGVVFVPALAGLGAPHWCSEARGTISGLTLATRPAHVARATLEAIALQIGDVLAAIETDRGQPFAALSIDGGAARNAMLAQMLADLLDHSIVRPHITEASALGVARLAAQAIGLTRTGTASTPADRFEPTLSAARREAIQQLWHSGVERVVNAPQPKRAAPE